jgi:hypothetical protein
MRMISVIVIKIAVLVLVRIDKGRLFTSQAHVPCDTGTVLVLVQVSGISTSTGTERVHLLMEID